MRRQQDGEPQYEVHLAGVIAERLRQILREALAQGRGAAVLAAYRQITQRLEQTPLTCGEPLYRLPALRLQVRAAVMGPLVVTFAVSENQPLVFIKGVELLP